MGTALVRLSEVLSTLKRHSTLLATLPHDIRENPCKWRKVLLDTIEQGSSKTLPWKSTFD
ncbi:MAG: hypothetical protein ABI210_04995 [Abditibacteriaceae bacterium]